MKNDINRQNVQKCNIFLLHNVQNEKRKRKIAKGVDVR